MFAIVETGGKQYKVAPQTEVEVELLADAIGEQVVLDHVLLIDTDGNTKTGNPYIEGAKVICKLLANGQGKKLICYTYKAKKNIRRKTGHRQEFSRLRVEEIVA